jgi:hypothetical protein
VLVERFAWLVSSVTRRSGVSQVMPTTMLRSLRREVT